MAIVAILSVISISALLSAQAQYTTTGAADQLISDIRQTRNFALETQTVNVTSAGTTTTYYPKLWALIIKSDNSVERDYYLDVDPGKGPNGNNAGWYITSDNTMFAGTLNRDFTSVSTTISGSASAGELDLIYNVPLGKFYPFSNPAGINNAKFSPDNAVFQSTKITNEDPGSTYAVQYTYRGSSSTVKIDAQTGIPSK